MTTSQSNSRDWYDRNNFYSSGSKPADGGDRGEMEHEEALWGKQRQSRRARRPRFGK